MLRLVHPPTIVYEVARLEAFAEERADIARLAHDLHEPLTAQALERFVTFTTDERIRGGLVVVRHPNSRRLCGVFPIVATEGLTRVGGEQPLVWRFSLRQSSVYLMRPRYIAEALDGLVRFVTESTWRGDVLVFEAGPRQNDRLADIRRYCREGGVTAWREEPHSDHEERLTLALSSVGACMVAGARWYDTLLGRREVTTPPSQPTVPLKSSDRRSGVPPNLGV
jgi:hypothetical protein